MVSRVSPRKCLTCADLSQLFRRNHKTHLTLTLLKLVYYTNTLGYVGKLQQTSVKGCQPDKKEDTTIFILKLHDTFRLLKKLCVRIKNFPNIWSLTDFILGYWNVMGAETRGKTRSKVYANLAHIGRKLRAKMVQLPPLPGSGLCFFSLSGEGWLSCPGAHTNLSE